MIRRIFLACMVMVMTGSMVVAQNAPENTKKGIEARAERMTERMAERYALTDKQKSKLQEANLALLEKIGDRPFAHRRTHYDRPRHHRRYTSSCCGCDAPRRHSEAVCHEGKHLQGQLTDEQRKEWQAKREQRRNDIKEARKAYRKQLQDILTEDQFDDYLDSNYRW